MKKSREIESKFFDRVVSTAVEGEPESSAGQPLY